MEFMFEKLDVYQRAVMFVETIDLVLDKVKGKIPASRLDQLARASLSIPLNIAEGNGRWHAGDRKQFITIARGSAFECIPILQILRNRSLLSMEEHQCIYGDLQIISKMLTSLIKYEGSRQSTEHS